MDPTFFLFVWLEVRTVCDRVICFHDDGRLASESWLQIRFFLLPFSTPDQVCAVCTSRKESPVLQPSEVRSYGLHGDAMLGGRTALGVLVCE